jgi:antitoxin MazE
MATLNVYQVLGTASAPTASTVSQLRRRGNDLIHLLDNKNPRNNIVITMQAIHVTIRPIGNSKGVVLPKPILAQAGLEEATDAEMTVENGVIILRKPAKPAKPARDGWAEAAKKLAAEGDDELVMGEFGNEGDAELVW